MPHIPMQIFRIYSCLRSYLEDEEIRFAAISDIHKLIDRFQSLWRTDIKNNEELAQLIKTVKKTMCKQKREPLGIGDIRFTFGKDETDKFQSENQERRAHGETYYTRLENDVGSKEKLVVIWIWLTTDRKEFMTDLILASVQPNHKHFFWGDRHGFNIVTHSEMRGLDPSDPTLCFWFKKDNNRLEYIRDLTISYTEEDRRDLTRMNYEMLPFCLSNFGLGYVNIWIRRQAFHFRPTTDFSHIQKELADYMAMHSRNPDDPTISKMVEETRWRLREVQMQQEELAKDIPGDAMVYTKEFLALTPQELEKMSAVFDERIDLDHDGVINVDDYRSFLSEPMAMTKFIMHVLTFSTDTPQYGDDKYEENFNIKFDTGLTLKATSVFCMFGESELLKSIFAWYDTKGYGEIDITEFKDLVEIFHPRRGNSCALCVLKAAESLKHGKVTFSQFEMFHEVFPSVFYPAFRVQEKMRNIFMGRKWWNKKLKKYEKARKYVEKEKKEAQKLEQMERRIRYEVAKEMNEKGIDFFMEKHSKNK